MAKSALPLKLDRNRNRNVDDVLDYVNDQLATLQQRFDNGIDYVKITVSHQAPARPRKGMIVYADGTDWNPGSGEGLYVYKSSWVFIV